MKKRNYLIRKLLFSFIIAMFSNSFLWAASGAINGYVKDTKTGKALPGANILVLGTSLGAASDLKGHYVIPSVPPGKYTLKVSFIGYHSKKVEVQVIDGESISNDFNLEYGALLEGEAVTITVQVSGQAAAINQQLASRTISNIVSSDRIQEIPDANAAESVGRLPGVSLVRSSGEGDKVVVRGMEPKLNLITVNGVRMPSTDQHNKSVGLAGVSPYMLAGIEVQKALTADKDADAIGGTVDLKLSEAPEGLKGNLIAEGGYNGLSGSFKTFKATAQASNRFFSNKLGLYGQVSIEQADRSNERLNASFIRSEDESIDAIITGAYFSYNALLRKRYGASIVGDYRLPAGKINVISILNQLDEDLITRQQALSVWYSHSNEYTTLSSKTKKYTWINSLNYEQSILGSTFDMSVSYTKGHREEPNRNNIVVEWMAAPGNEIFDDSLKQENSNAYDIQKHVIEDVDYAIIARPGWESYEFDEDEYTLQTNLEIPYHVFKQMSGAVKFGGKYRHKNRAYDQGRAGARLINGGHFPVADAIERDNPEIDFTPRLRGIFLPAAPIIDTDFEKDILDGKVSLKNFIKREWVDQIIGRLNAAHWDNIHGTYDKQFQIRNDYHGSEDISAAYIMTELNIGKSITFIPGVRYEHARTDYSSFGVTDLGQGDIQVDSLNNAIRVNDYWLPMIHFRYKFQDWSDVRLSYTKSLARPDYYYFIPRYFLTTQLDLTNIGNRRLMPAVSNNYDVYFSFYSNKLGLLTMGGFYKEITNFFYQRNSPVIDKEVDNAVHNYDVQANTTKLISMWFNNEYPADVKGLELDWQTNFWYLPKPFNGIVLNVNYTHIFSETKYYEARLEQFSDPATPWIIEFSRIDSFRTRSLIRQPDDIANIQIGYDYKGFSARVSYYFQGKTLTGIGSNKENDNFATNYQRWDLSVRQKLVKGLMLYMNVSNIFDVPDKHYRYKEKFSTSEEYYGLIGTLGLRYTF